MQRGRCWLVVLALLVVSAWMNERVGAENQKVPSIKAIMKKANDGDESLFGQVGKQLLSDEPNWTDIRTKTKELIVLADSLGKNTPPKGARESWENLTKAYVANLKVLDDAAQKKNKDMLDAAHQKLITSCSGCHKLHKGK
jgi:hypothetical protein